MKIIPAIDLKEGKCVRLLQGDPGQQSIYSEDPMEIARQWEQQGAEFLHIIDLDGAFSGTPMHLDMIERIAQSVRVPFQVGGGIRTIEDISQVLQKGASRVILGTKAVASPLFLREACRRYQGQVLLGIDARGGFVAIEGWTRATSIKAIDFARQVSHYDLAGIVYTDIHRDGMLTGPNLVSLSELAEAIRLPLIASGGISSLADVRAVMALEPKGISGMIIGQALYTGRINLKEAIALTKGGKGNAG